MSFWDGMKLWEKMLFVLGVAMGFTLFYACAKLIISKRRIRKYSQLEEARKTHLDGVRASRNIIQLQSDEIPFGIKALEAGIQVEGVVVSRSVTPVSSRPNYSQQTLVGSDSDSLASRTNGHTSGTGVQMQRSGKPAVFQPSPYVTIPPAVYHSQSASSSFRSSATSLASNAGPQPLDNNGSYGRRSSSEPNFHHDHTRSVSGPVTPPAVSAPDAATLARLEGRLPSLPRKSGPPRTRSPSVPGYISYNALHSPSVTPPSRSPTTRSPGSSRTPSPPEDVRSSGLPSVHEDESEESSRNSDSSEGDRSIRPRLMSAFSSPVVSTVPGTVSKQGDLSLLHTHRLSHAAEVGQLLPRPRVSRISSLPQTSSASFVSPPTEAVYELDLEALHQAIPQGDGAGDVDVEPHNPSMSTQGRRRANSDPSTDPEWAESSNFVQEIWDRSFGTEGVDVATNAGTDLQQAFDKAAKQKAQSSPKKLQKKRWNSHPVSKDDIDLEAQ